MNCPFCDGPSQVKDSRPTADGVRRRRECKVCHRRFTTFEQLANMGLRVIKAGGQRTESFDETKIRAVVRRVCRERPVSERQIRWLSRRLQAELMEEGVSSVKSSEIARRVFEALTPLDPLAAERFAVNYRGGQGQLRFERRAERPAEEPQLGLFDLGAPED